MGDCRIGEKTNKKSGLARLIDLHSSNKIYSAGGISHVSVMCRNKRTSICHPSTFHSMHTTQLVSNKT